MKWVMTIVIVALVVGGGAYWYLNQEDELTRATDKGLRYIKNSYQDFSYDDEYLQYRYPGEELFCDIDGCDLTYRLLDAYFDVVMLSRAGVTEAELGQQLTDANAVFKSIRPVWQKGTIMDTIASEGNENFALDTYCILGYLNQDDLMADTVERYRTGNGWFEDNHFVQDTWRNIADETWCLRLLIATNKATEVLPDAIQRKINETNAYLIDEPLINQQAALYHMIYLMYDAVQKQIPLDEAGTALAYYSKQIALMTLEADLWYQSLALANTLEALASIGYPEKETLDLIAKHLVTLQREDGSWWASPLSDNGSVFTTIRAALALKEYKNLNNNQ